MSVEYATPYVGVQARSGRTLNSSLFREVGSILISNNFVLYRAWMGSI